MAKKQKLSRDEQEKAEMEKIQKRVENLLPPKADIPSPISIQQAEELKAHISELEAQLAQQKSTENQAANEVDRKTNAPSATEKSVRSGKLSTASSPTSGRFAWLSRLWGQLTKAHPSITDLPGKRRAQLTSALSLVLTLTNGTALFFVGRDGIDATFYVQIALTLVTLLAYLVSRTSRHFLGSVLLTASLSISGFTFVLLGSTDPTRALYSSIPPALVIGSVLLPVWGNALFYLGNLIGILVLQVIYPSYTTSGSDASLLVSLSILLLVVQIFRNNLEREQLTEVKTINEELRELSVNLEHRVADRTHDLELASEVGRTIAEKVGNISAMLTDATEMIRARFKLYYTQVYLLDPSGQTITLRAGTGSTGQQLLRRGHHLLVSSSSLNGRAVSEKKPVIVADTAKNDSFLPNPLLPKTRSEMAIPLLVGDKVLGVLDMQSETPNALNEDNLAAFQVLAGQLSVAIQNAILFAQSEEARKQVEENVRQIATVGWQDFLNGTERGEKIGYVFDQTEVKPLARKSRTKSDNALSVPITVTGATVGTIQVAQNEREWTSSENLIIRSTADQLAQHIENLRLLSQAEKFRQEAEQINRRLTREGWQGYLQTHNTLVAGYSFDPNEVKTENEEIETASASTLSLPITVRDEAIGELMINTKNIDHQAMDEIFSAVAAQLGDHIENLRLSEQNEKRAYELATVATVSTTASTVLDPDKLLQAVVDLTKERFNLYHVHIYLADESWNTLLLAAGAGDVGRQMVSEGWAIPINHEQSIVANVARNRQSIIANDLYHDKDSSFLSNRLLPETRSEMAVPMIAGDKLLGVFDVQADLDNFFSEEDANIYTTLAAQVAIALQNARLYQEQAATVTQLRELDRLKSSFLANMSHELRTPLNSILGFADVMLEELDGPLTENMSNDLSLIHKNGQHLLHLINDVLDMAKIDSGKLNLSIEQFNLQETIEEVVSITSPLANEKNLALVIEPDSDHEVEINADKIRVRQVMINLINNAMKFTEKGNISIRVVREESNVLISVKDNGIGIPVDHLESVFQEFTQVDTSTTRKTGGTGLGLPISRRLIEMHSGRLWAESSGIDGEGSTFYIFLPIESKIKV